MTIVIPKPDMLDRLLRVLGKKRGVALHGAVTNPAGTQTYFAPKKESPLKSLLRPSGKSLPDGMVDVFTLQHDGEMSDRTARRQTWMPLAMSGPTSREFFSLIREVAAPNPGIPRS